MDRVELDVVVVGAGFAGLFMVHRALGMGMSVEAIDAADGVGGTWWWNRYPGARCDVPSMEYSYGFDDELQQEWEWSERYATQPEILSYLEHVADRFELRPHLKLGTRIEQVFWDDAAQAWDVVASDGITRRTRFVVMATGCLSAANMPDIPGRDLFAGRTFHTGRWPHEPVDFSGRRVAVIGTGSSGVQSIPLIAEQADQVTVLQRTPAYAVPAHNGPLDPAEVARIKADYVNWRKVARNSRPGYGGHVPRPEVSALAVGEQERTAAYDARWDVGGLLFLGAFNDLLLDTAANDTAADYLRARIAAVVDDPNTATALSPDTIVGCKRLCLDSGYYSTYNRPNVRLVDIAATPIERIDPAGVVIGGEVHEVDDIVFATGFDAMTGALDRIHVEGRNGQTLRDAWAAGPTTLLGLQVAGFPNLFTVTGPGSPSVLTNMISSIEHHVEWIAELLSDMTTNGYATVEATPAAQAEWVDYVNAVADMTLFPNCNSWYLGANVPGKPRVFMPLPGFPEYVTHCSNVADQGYPGFVRS
jgi:cyclohexanone monooxygenase